MQHVACETKTRQRMKARAPLHLQNSRGEPVRNAAGDGLAIESYVKKFRPSQSETIGAPSTGTLAQQLMALFTLRGASSTHLFGKATSAAHGEYLFWSPGKEPPGKEPPKGSWRGAAYTSITVIHLQAPSRPQKRVEMSWSPWHRPQTNVLSCWIRCSEFLPRRRNANDEPSLKKVRLGWESQALARTRI